MNDATLRQLYEQHQGKASDKWSIYLTEYDRLFAPYRRLPVRMLEIGIQNGGSLDIWSKYFPAALHIVGCDIDPDCARLSYADPRVSVVVGDANTDAIEAEIAASSAQFDLIVDDGSHTSSDIVRSFVRYFPRLADGGLFVAEDLHCSYWQDFQGGLFDPASSIAFFKRLADVINHEHWGVSRDRRDVLSSFARKYGLDIDEESLSHVHSVEFINSLCVVRKDVPAANVAGPRFIAGAKEIVADGHLGLHLTPVPTVNEGSNSWSSRALLPEDEFEVAKAELARLHLLERQHAKQAARLALLGASLAESRSHAESVLRKLRNTEVQIAGMGHALEHARQRQSALEAQLAGYRRQAQQILASTSWRVSSPVRWLGLQLGRIRRVTRIVPTVVQRGGGVLSTARRAAEVLRESGTDGVRRSARTIESEEIAATAAAVDEALGQEQINASRDSYIEWLSKYDLLDEAQRLQMRQRIETMANKPLISVVMPSYNANLTWLRAAIESVRGQIYPYWELCIADDASPSVEAREFLAHCAAGDQRIKVVYRTENGHIAAASNSALELVSGSWVALMDHDDLLPEHALFWIADAIDKHPGVQLIYSDEDKIDDVGIRSDPYFKPDWNIDLFYSQNMFSHLGVFSTELIRKVGGFRVGMEGSQDYDLVLRCLEHVRPSQVVHLPKVLYHWRMHAESTAMTTDAKPYARIAGERALNEHLERSGIKGRVEHAGCGYRVRYELPDPLPLVSLIIPTRNAVALVRQCVNSIWAQTTYDNYEIIVVDNGSDDEECLRYLRSMEEARVFRVIRDDREFNYSALNNMAVASALGEFVALINNDIEVISPDWLSEMVSIAMQSGVGAVGARLWYPDRTLQHGGVVLGVGGVANHAHKGLSAGQDGHFGRANLIQSFSAVTAACLVIRKDRYEAVGGLNEVDLKVAFNDVDFCLRLQEAGFRNVWTPYAELIHHESATRGSDVAPEKRKRFVAEVEYMMERWGHLLPFDPAYNPNLTLLADDFGPAWPCLAWPPRERGDMTLV